jgi:hypothetical protein
MRLQGLDNAYRLSLREKNRGQKYEEPNLREAMSAGKGDSLKIMATGAGREAANTNMLA